MKVKNEEIQGIRMALRALRDYEHPDTRAGIRQDTTIKIMQLDRALRTAGEDYDEAVKATIVKWGEEKVLGKPESSFVSKTSEFMSDYRADKRAIDKTEFDVDDKFRILRSELKVRDAEGELVEVECGRIGDLGPVLALEEAQKEKKADNTEVTRKPSA